MSRLAVVTLISTGLRLPIHPRVARSDRSKMPRRAPWCVLAALLAVLAVTASPSRADADTVDPGTAPPIRTLTYNVCGASAPCRSALTTRAWATEVRRQAAAWSADAVMLQELCIGQWIELRRTMPDYSLVWTSTAYASGCARWSADGDTRFGLGVLVKTSEVDRFAANLSVPSGQERRAVLCARGPVDGRRTLVCTTHLAQYVTPDNGSSQVMEHIDGWADGLPVILGGDFNAAPTYPALDPVRAGTSGTGPFAEVDENDRAHFTPDCLSAGATVCRSGAPTVNIAGTPKKFDHIFVTARDFRTVRGDVVEPGLSDHRLLRGAAHPE